MRWFIIELLFQPTQPTLPLYTTQFQWHVTLISVNDQCWYDPGSETAFFSLKAYRAHTLAVQCHSGIRPFTSSWLLQMQRHRLSVPLIHRAQVFPMLWRSRPTNLQCWRTSWHHSVTNLCSSSLLSRHTVIDPFGVFLILLCVDTMLFVVSSLFVCIGAK